MKKQEEGQIRMEDLAKQLLATAEKIDRKVVVREIENHFLKLESENAYPKSVMLYSKELGFHQLFILENNSPLEVAEWIMGYMDDSVAFIKDTENFIDLNDIRQIENSTETKDSHSLDIWCSTYYFQLMPFDWGIEIVGKGQDGWM